MLRIERAGMPALLSLILAACGSEAPDTRVTEDTAAGPPAAASPGPQLACTPQRSTADRSSPYDSTTIQIGSRQARICYSRPAVRGRMVFDSLVPYDRLWRTGANEPTTLHVPFAARIAGVEVQPGSYSIYTIPTRGDWTVIVNRSTAQWGIESSYTAEIEAQEVGRGTAPSASITEPVESFTIRSEPAGENAANLILEWAHTRVVIPIEAL